MRRVALITLRFRRNMVARFLSSNPKNAHPPEKRAVSLYMDFEAHALVALVIAFLADGALTLGHARLEHQQGLVRPPRDRCRDTRPTLESMLNQLYFR